MLQKIAHSPLITAPSPSEKSLSILVLLFVYLTGFLSIFEMVQLLI